MLRGKLFGSMAAVGVLMLAVGSLNPIVQPTWAEPGPATRPTTRRANPEEAERWRKYAYAPIDVPQVKIFTFNPDNSVHPKFGEPDETFLAKHQAILERKKEPIGVLFLGDSITEAWRHNPAIWENSFGRWQPANFGIGGDRIQHVLWRIGEGVELDGVTAKAVVLMLGTNNVMYNSPDEIARGVGLVAARVREKLPEAKLLVLGIFPRGQKPGVGKTDEIRAKLQAANQQIAKLADGKDVKYLELWKEFLTPEGEITKEMMGDYLHPGPKGYQIWADAVTPVLEEMMK